MGPKNCCVCWRFSDDQTLEFGGFTVDWGVGWGSNPRYVVKVGGNQDWTLLDVLVLDNHLQVRCQTIQTCKTWRETSRHETCGGSLESCQEERFRIRRVWCYAAITITSACLLFLLALWLRTSSYLPSICWFARATARMFLHVSLSRSCVHGWRE